MDCAQIYEGFHLRRSGNGVVYLGVHIAARMLCFRINLDTSVQPDALPHSPEKRSRYLPPKRCSRSKSPAQIAENRSGSGRRRSWKACGRRTPMEATSPIYSGWLLRMIAARFRRMKVIPVFVYTKSSHCPASRRPSFAGCTESRGS